jgi:hypothetical protein
MGLRWISSNGTRYAASILSQTQLERPQVNCRAASGLFLGLRDQSSCSLDLLVDVEKLLKSKTHLTQSERYRMRSKIMIILLGAILACSSVVYAVPTYYLANGALPTDLGVLTAERNVWQSAAGVSLSMEGFESFSAGNPLDFGPFTATLIDGIGFTQISGNSLVTTEGNSVMDFVTLGSTAVEFSFDNAINAFGIDITSIDFPTTTVSFLDDNGTVLNDFAIDGQFAGATFFGVINDQSFSKARFNFTGNEFLNLDYLQYGSNPENTVPEPGTLSLLGLGLVGAAVTLLRKR